MTNTDRGLIFGKYVGLELKGAIISRGNTAAGVAKSLGHSQSAFTNWLNGKVQIPISVVVNASEVIGIEPSQIIDAAYDRLVYEFGEFDGFKYSESNVTPIGKNLNLPEDFEKTELGAAYDGQEPDDPQDP